MTSVFGKVLGILIKLTISSILIGGVGIGAAFIIFGPVGKSGEFKTFVVPRDTKEFIIENELYKQKLIKNPKTFRFLLNTNALGKEIKPGGYLLSNDMNMFKILAKITGKPDLVWFKLSYCPRKEQVGEYLAETLNWNSDQVNEWNDLYKNDKPEYFEGVYYPDTYLIPVSESPAQVAQRLINRFEEKFAPLSDKFISENIKWTTGLKIASLIAREAGGEDDIKLISGIIWNRLNTGMRLQIDATMQYTLGKKADGSWWGPVSISEKLNESAYNTYLHEGLPPTPICSPSIEYIEAALDPEETDCLFYLHGKDRQIHCAKTYKEHLENIENYLK